MAGKLMAINVPKVLKYSKEHEVMEMERLDGWMSVADMYTEDISNVPVTIIDSIRYILDILYKNDIVYVDVTGYNFMIHIDTCKEKIKNGTFDYKDIYIIDFEHAYMKSPDCEEEDFLHEFLKECKNTWNPDFI